MSTLKDILDNFDIKQPETAASNADRTIAVSGKNVKHVVLGSATGKQLPAVYDPDTRVFYPVFQQA